MKKWFINSGVQVNHSMVNPLDFVVDSCAIQEFRAFPYANAQECKWTWYAPPAGKDIVTYVLYIPEGSLFYASMQD